MSRDIAVAIRSEATQPADTLDHPADPLNHLLERHIAEARGRGGELDLDSLLKTVSTHYDRIDRSEERRVGKECVP